ncbi:MAG: hypothetical protein Q8N10_12350 [Phenylobacterium sp.]|nr:hypothetical protein [Phenylobacterium sp.]MDO8910230.1 hypothetical protein [Phenylobacterium sp.]MDP3101279.1 hypothetical protein [Phenylobacterium sp.]
MGALLLVLKLGWLARSRHLDQVRLLPIDPAGTPNTGDVVAATAAVEL